MDNDVDELIEEAHNRGDDVLNLLYRGYAIPLFRFCRGRGLADADAEDVCHDVMLKAVHSLDRFRFGEPMWPWLTTIAANACTDLIRRRSRSVSVAIVPDSKDENSAECEVIRRESVELFQTALTNLPKQYASLLYLREYESRPYAEIGSLLGLSLSSVRSRLLRARRALRLEVTRLLGDSSTLLSALLAAWMQRLRRNVTRLSPSARILESHFASLAIVLMLVSVSVGQNSRPISSEGSGVDLKHPDIPVAAHSLELPVTSLKSSADDPAQLSKTDSTWHRTTTVSIVTPVGDPTDGSEVRIVVGPVEIWCPWFNQYPLAQEACEELAPQGEEAQ